LKDGWKFSEIDNLDLIMYCETIALMNEEVKPKPISAEDFNAEFMNM